MRIHTPIRSFKDVEEFLEVIILRLPHIPASLIDSLVAAMPYITTVIGSILIASALVPFFQPTYDPYAHLGLFAFNVVLLRISAIVFGLVLVTSFTQLSQKRLRGWYGLFYLSVLYVMFTLLLLNIFSVVTLILSWYVLFNIKKKYS